MMLTHPSQVPRPLGAIRMPPPANEIPLPDRPTATLNSSVREMPTIKRRGVVSRGFSPERRPASNGAAAPLNSSTTDEAKGAQPHEESGVMLGRLYLGNAVAALDPRILFGQLRCTHVVNCAATEVASRFVNEKPPNGHGAPEYRLLRIMDMVDPTETSKLHKSIPDTCNFIHQALRSGGHVLVHCVQGISRSTSIVIAYLMLHYNMRFPDALQRVRSARFCANPNPAFQRMLNDLHRDDSPSTSVGSMQRTYPSPSTNHALAQLANKTSPIVIRKAPVASCTFIPRGKGTLRMWCRGCGKHKDMH